MDNSLGFSNRLLYVTMQRKIRITLLSIDIDPRSIENYGFRSNNFMKCNRAKKKNTRTNKPAAATKWMNSRAWTCNLLKWSTCSRYSMNSCQNIHCLSILNLDRNWNVNDRIGDTFDFCKVYHVEGWVFRRAVYHHHSQSFINQFLKREFTKKR